MGVIDALTGRGIGGAAERHQASANFAAAVAHQKHAHGKTYPPLGKTEGLVIGRQAQVTGLAAQVISLALSQGRPNDVVVAEE